MSTTAHEAARKKVKISDVWRRMERARVEVGLLMDLTKEGVSVPQVESIINNLGGAKKSNKGGGRGRIL